MARKGDEHEQTFLRSLIDRSLDVVVVPSVFDGAATQSEAVEATTAAMRAGAAVVYQGALTDGDWRGFADFLERVASPCPAFGDYSYEVVDTKLAKHSKPSYLVQLCLYSDLLARVQGKQPECMHVVLGVGRTRNLPLARVLNNVSRQVLVDLRAAQQLVTAGVLVAQVDLMRAPTKERLAEKLSKAIHEEIASPLLACR